MKMHVSAGVLFVVSGLTASAHGLIHLSGVVSYGANASGASITEPAEYDNILATGNLPVTINGQVRGTTFLLNDGPNAFTFTGVGGNYNALSLYLGPTGDAFSRPFASLPDLVTYGSSMPLTPAAGTLVQTNGQYSGLGAYSGATSFTIGDLTVSVTGFTFANGSGTFELTVVPAPSAAALLGLSGLMLIRRRR
jgi:hypothetical protein